MNAFVQKPLEEQATHHSLADGEVSEQDNKSHRAGSSPENASITFSSPTEQQFTSSSPHMPSQPLTEPSRRKPVPRVTSQELYNLQSSPHLPEDMSRYPSTISGHIGQATRDNRFADATGPYQMVLLDECRKITELNPGRGIMAESRDPTYSSFEAFVLAPSTSSFTLYDKQNVSTSNDGKENTPGRLVADRRSENKTMRTPKSSPLKNQVKSSMESRRTVTSGKHSFDTVRSGRSTAEKSESGSKRDDYTWNLFTRIDENGARRPDTTRERSSESEYHSPPSKPPSPPAVTPKTRRQIRKLSVQPISPFYISSRSLDISDRKSPSPDDRNSKNRKLETGEVGISPASDKTIKSFSALHRPSTDVSVAGGDTRGMMIQLGRIDETPTKGRKNLHSVTQLDSTLHLPQLPIPAAISLPSHRPHPRIKLVRNRLVSTLSESGISRVNTRYLDDQDLRIRLDAHDPDDRRESDIQHDTATKDVTSGYWDYSIVTGIGGSPSKDYALLMRNASLMKQFADAPSGSLQRETPAATAKPSTIDLLLGNPRNNSLFRNTDAPRSASDKSLTSSSTYPDDTDEPSENGRHGGKRRARHARRRGNRPPSMASLAAPLGEDLEAEIASVPSVGNDAFGPLNEDVHESEAENQVLVQMDVERDHVRVPTPEESSFGQSLAEVATDIENGALFTRFATPPISSSVARQIQQFKALPPAFHFPSPPPSQKHSSLLSDILAVTRDSYQARKEYSDNNADGLPHESDAAVPLTRTPGMMHNGRTFRGSVVVGRTGDAALQIIHEDETPSRPNPPLTSESLRQLGRIIATELDGSGSAQPTHSTCLSNLGQRTADMSATVNFAAAPVGRIPAGFQMDRHGSSDNLSLATTTTMRPSLHTTQPRHNRAGRNESTIRRVITSQPSRAFVPLVPVGADRHMRRVDDELPEGIYSNSPGSSSFMCVCFGRHLW
ncbi:hypothetical protein QFC21_002790 [Naganishia friedmannii]|uniref:Uncharacterized protein n=1 Tax=Naganishia friedmannii TaxID=89922 RepID=A0ACC2VU61_9TREE|nr:hypothetical protein QFC21_002790 [Naganishia friedmannii]